MNKPVDYLGAYVCIAEMAGITRTEVPLETLLLSMAETKKLESKLAELEARDFERRAETAKQKPLSKAAPPSVQVKRINDNQDGEK